MITPTHCNAPKAHLDDTLIWLITVSTGEKFVAHEVTRDCWHAWHDIPAMREGDTRVCQRATRLTDLIALLDEPGSVARREMWARVKAEDVRRAA